MRFFVSLCFSLLLHFLILFSNDMISLINLATVNKKPYIPSIKIQLQEDNKKINDNQMAVRIKKFNKDSKVVDLNKRLHGGTPAELDFYKYIQSVVYKNWHNKINESYSNIKENGIKETIVAFKMNSKGRIVDKIIKEHSISDIADEIALTVFDSQLTLPSPPQDVIEGHDFIVLIMGFSIP